MKKYICLILTIFLTLFYTFLCLGNTSSGTVDVISYSNVLDDLKKSEDFAVEDYPTNNEDYSLSVITIAEGTNAQLFVYVFQPSYAVKSLQASSINISLGAYSQLSFKNYKLNLVDMDGMFQKYAVEGLVVSSESSRYYQISSIFRPWDSTIDAPADAVTENTISEVSFQVGKQYVFEQSGANIELTISDVDTITVTQKYCGFVRFLAHPWSVFGNDYDAHFVAFKTDKKIDNLYYADITYVSQKFNYYWNSASLGDITLDGEGNLTALTESEVVYKTISDKDDVTIDTGGLFGKTYFFNRIQTVEDFKNTLSSYEEGEDIDVEYNEEKLLDTEWVLRFCETDYIDRSLVIPVIVNDYDFTKISEVSIMRLYFETDGVIYNLGVIDNKQTGSNNPFATVEPVDYTDFFEKLMALVALLILVVLFWPILLPFLSWIIKLVFNGFILLIKLPFWLLGKLFRGKKK